MRKYPRTDNPWGFAAFLFCLLALATATACGGGGGMEEESAEPEEMMEEPAAEEEAMDMGPRIFFIQPDDGAEVTSPVTFEFGIEGLGLAPKETYEEGTGHHHIGLTDQCVPAGEAIPEADPWVHLGDASKTIDMQLPPGDYAVTIQLGDGDHVAFEDPGLCQTINITVVEG
jgi:hypothetical protein